MHISLNVLGLEHLWVIYPGQNSYAIQERVSTCSIRNLVDLGQLLKL
jgi:hypothetical protein